MNNLEVEIAELQKMIEVKRDQLEKAGGIVEEKELVRESVKEMFLDATEPKTTQATQTDTAQVTTSAQAQPISEEASYLDYLDQQTTETINNLIAEIPTKGITAVIDQVAGQEPFVIDAFHDALVDKLYDELKQRRLVK